MKIGHDGTMHMPRPRSGDTFQLWRAAWMCGVDTDLIAGAPRSPQAKAVFHAAINQICQTVSTPRKG